MNWLDVALTILAVGSVISGIREGFSRTGFGFLAVIVAFLSAAWLYPANLKPFIVVFIGLLCAAALGAFLVGRWFKTAGVKPLDAILGGVVGLTNALLLSTAAAAQAPTHWSMVTGETVSPDHDAMDVAVGWPAARFDFKHGVSDRSDGSDALEVDAHVPVEVEADDAADGVLSQVAAAVATLVPPVLGGVVGEPHSPWVSSLAVVKPRALRT